MLEAVKDPTELEINFLKRGGYVPVILQDADSGQIRDVVYANNFAVRKTIHDKRPIYSGPDGKECVVDDFILDNILVDCDQDALIYLGMSVSDRLDFKPLQQSDHINFGQDGLVPAIAQEYGTGNVLMLGYANAEALEKSRDDGKATFWSTSRDELWTKGNISGDFLKIKSISANSPGSVILYEVVMAGKGACHTKNSAGRTRKSCFYRRIVRDRLQFLSGQR